MNLNTYVVEILDKLSTTTLELYQDDNEFLQQEYDELIIPIPIEKFITDIHCKKFILPPTLKVLDLWFNDYHSFECNIPTNIKTIIIRYVNINNISIMNLFPNNCSYRYIEVSINNIELNIIINQLYTKYFNKDSKYISNNISYKGLMNNMIYSKNHNIIINEIKIYEQKIIQGSAFCKIIKEELIDKAFHPDRICPLIKKYGIKVIEEF